MSRTLAVDSDGNFVRTTDEHDLAIMSDADELIASIEFLLRIQIGEMDNLVTDDTGLDRIPLLGKDVDGDEALQAIEDCIISQIAEVSSIEDGSIDLDYANRVATVSLVINAVDGTQLDLTTDISTNV